MQQGFDDVDKEGLFCSHVDLANFVLGDVVEEFEEAGSELDRISHDDGLGDAFNGVESVVDGGVEEVVAGFFKGGEHEGGLFHF